MRKIIRVGDSFLRFLNRLDWFPALLARIAVGTVFLESGWGKLHHLPKVIEFFESLGLPAASFQAHLVATTELVCGGMVLVGLLARLAGVPLIITMVVAILTAKRAEITGLSDLFGMSEFLYIVLLLWIGFAGPGLLSVDRLLRHRLTRSQSTEAA